MRCIPYLSLLIVSATISCIASAQTQSINNVHPANFPAFEQLFLQGNCNASFPAAYVYDLTKQEWLNYDQALAIVPEANELLSQQQCDISITRDELAQQLNLQWIEPQGFALLFFDYPEKIFDVFYSNDPKRVARYEQLLSTLSALDHLPRYRIKTPLTGLQNQF